MDTITLAEWEKVLKSVRPGHPPVLAIGSTGIGKTAVMEQIISEDKNALLCAPPPLPVVEEVDLLGIPKIYDDYFAWLPPKWLALLVRQAVEQGLQLKIVLDEISRAKPEVMNGLYPLLRTVDKRIGDLEIPDNSVVFAAMNPPDYAHVNKLDPAFAARFVMFEVEVDPLYWLKWAEKEGIHPAIIAYITRYDNKLHMPPEDPSKPHPNPRGWHYASISIEAHGGITDLALKSVAGSIGKGAAEEFAAFAKNFKNIPDPKDVLLGKVSFPKNRVLDLQYLTASAIASKIRLQPDTYFIPFLENSVHNNWPSEVVNGNIWATLVRQDVMNDERTPDLAVGRNRKVFEKWCDKYLDNQKKAQAIYDALEQ